MSIVDEEWRDVSGFEGYYQVSNLGRVRSLDRIVFVDRLGKVCTRNSKGRILAVATNTGYCLCGLTNGVHKVKVSVHCLVAKAFLGDRPSSYEVNHIDGDKTNNAVSNLEYCSRKDNMAHAHRLGLCASSVGDNHYGSKISSVDVPVIRQRLANGERPSVICKDYGVIRRTIAFINVGATWKHVK